MTTQTQALELARSALKELVAQNEGRFLAIKHDHFAMQDARSAIRRLDEALASQQEQYPFGVYDAEDLNRAWKSGYDNCKAQKRRWVGLDAEEIRKTDHHMVCGAYHYSFKQGAEWAESKLKEKNT
jgi:hypothetical protein